VNPLAEAVRMTCSPKLNVVAAFGATVKLSAEAVIDSEPPLAHVLAFAEPMATEAAARMFMPSSG